MWDAFLAGARSSRCEAAVGETDGATVRKLQVVLEEATIEGEPRNFGGIVEAIEFFFLNGKEETVFVEKSDSGTVTERGDTQKVHEFWISWLLPGLRERVRGEMLTNFCLECR